MTTVYKYPIDLTVSQTLELPKDAKIIHAGVDPAGIICIWAVVDTREYNTEDRTIYVIGTGNRVPFDENKTRHVTSFMHGGTFMWHVFTPKHPAD